MKQLSRQQINILLFLVRLRLRNEAKRPSKIRFGKDIQAQKVWELKELAELLEEIQEEELVR